MGVQPLHPPPLSAPVWCCVGREVKHRNEVVNWIGTVNRPVSYSNGWTGSSMKWRLMRAN